MLYIPKHKPDKDLIYWGRLKNGDPDALGYFYDNYIDQLFLAAIKMTDKRELAKDSLQEVFLEIWHYRKTIGDISHTQSYLVKVLRTIVIKKMKNEFPVTYNLSYDLLDSTQENIEDLIISTDTHNENSGKLKRAVSNLTNRQKLILQLHFYEGLTYKQIADRLCMNHQSVNNLAFRTMLRLRGLMYTAITWTYIVLG